MNANHEIIGFVPKYDVAAWNERCIKQFDPQDYHVSNDAKEFAAVAHLGLVAPEVVQSLILEGLDWITETFKSNSISKTRGGWFHPLSRGMLLCLLAGHEAELHSICSWAKPTKKPEYRGPLPDEVQQAYLVLAGQFQDSPPTGFARLLTKLQACKKRAVKPLIEALSSVVDRDQKSFESTIKKCVEQHKKLPKPEPDAYFMEEWLPLHANTIFLAGLSLGLKDPGYPPEIAAYLMTPKSVGFD